MCCLLFWVSQPVFFWSCSKDSQFDCLKSTGHTKTETRETAPFSTIQIYDNIEVELVKDSSYFVELVAGENLLGNLKTDVSNGTLTLENINKCNWVRSYKRSIKAVVHAPAFSRIIHDGSKTVTNRGVLQQDTIRLDVTDAGDFNLTLQADKIYVTQYEYGNITLNGTASLFVFENFGVGKIYAQHLKANLVWANVYGSGDSHVFPIEALSTTFNNSGNVYYYNQPTNTQRLGNGAGQNIYKEE